jgi:hypothetical protein
MTDPPPKPLDDVTPKKRDIVGLGIIRAVAMALVALTVAAIFVFWSFTGSDPKVIPITTQPAATQPR